MKEKLKFRVTRWKKVPGKPFVTANVFVENIHSVKIQEPLRRREYEPGRRPEPSQIPETVKTMRQDLMKLRDELNALDLEK